MRIVRTAVAVLCAAYGFGQVSGTDAIQKYQMGRIGEWPEWPEWGPNVARMGTERYGPDWVFKANCTGIGVLLPRIRQNNRDESTNLRGPAPATATFGHHKAHFSRI
jgi:hypothetical protein